MDEVVSEAKGRNLFFSTEVLMNWGEIKTYVWQRTYDNMQKPTCVFDGCNILDHSRFEVIGFVYNVIGVI